LESLWRELFQFVKTDASKCSVAFGRFQSPREGQPTIQGILFGAVKILGAGGQLQMCPHPVGGELIGPLIE
jgi:hypothetical protein